MPTPQNLRTPGPTPVPDRVMRAMQKQMINHRSTEFSDILKRATGLLQKFFSIGGNVFIYPASGTGGLEASVVNTLSPGDTVLGLTIGYFGDRYLDIAKDFGINVIRMEKAWGQVFQPEEVAAAIRQQPNVKAVLITHNETSTGAVNPIREISQAVKAHNPETLMLVDSISGLCSIELPMDSWNVDIVISGSQKSWMIPPGLVFLGISDLAWQAHKNSKLPRHYWSFSHYEHYLERWQTPYTPAVNLFYALDEALKMIEEETLEGFQSRHQRVADHCRSLVREFGSHGLGFFADQNHLSNSVTAVKVGQGIDVKRLVKEMEEQRVALGGGLGKHASEYFRIGHLGWVHEADIDDVFEKLATIPSLRPAAVGGL